MLNDTCAVRHEIYYDTSDWQIEGIVMYGTVYSAPSSAVLIYISSVFC